MRTSATARLIVMTVLALGLLVPLTWIYALVSERAARRDQAAADIGATWGAPQVVTGPILDVPYTAVRRANDGRFERVVYHAMWLPRDLQVEGSLRAETRHRGIFDVVVYHAPMTITGRFAAPALGDLGAESIDWARTTLNVGLSDPRGLTRRATLKWNGAAIPVTGGVVDAGLFRSGLQAPVAAPAPAGGDVSFELTLDLNGTRDLRFVPAAEQTTVALSSNWPHPSFDGQALPQTRQIGSDGFTARWVVQDFGRPYPGRWTNAQMKRDELFQAALDSSFGVSLVQPVDIYQQAERSVKYAALFVVLTFLVFFLWEVFHATLLHPVQYTFVGFALCVFYLLLVSLSEHVGFDSAYMASSAATTALIGGYARSILRGNRAALSVAFSLASLYGFLYLLLRLEDYALLAGSIGLFVVLAGVMFITRRMNWYDLRLGASEPGDQEPARTRS
jgi:inner membrane protein